MSKQVQLLANYMHRGTRHIRGATITVDDKDARDLCAIGFAREVQPAPGEVKTAAGATVKLSKYNRRDMRAKGE
jgi:hypothetical protein